MARKAKVYQTSSFADQVSSLTEVRRALQSRSLLHGSDDYKALIRHWRKLCRQNGAVLVAQKANEESWHKLFLNCPHRTPEEKAAYACWQSRTPNDPDLERHRARAVREGLLLAEKLFGPNPLAT